jgi:hypothetical protein
MATLGFTSTSRKGRFSLFAIHLMTLFVAWMTASVV